MLADWARRLGVSDEVLIMRLERGWSLERALTRPVRRYRKRGEQS